MKAWAIAAAGVAVVLFAVQRGGSMVFSQQVINISKAISVAEGTFNPDGSGNPETIGYQRNNPGDLEDSAGNIRSYLTMEAGWNALYAQVAGMVSGTSSVYSPNMPLAQVAGLYTGNDNAGGWAATVARELGASVADPFGSLGV